MTLPDYAMNQARFPEIYEQSLVGPLFRPMAEALLDRVELVSGDSVLDIACGTGIVARLARERLGGRTRVVGVDVSLPMLTVARTTAPSIDWREGSATALPIGQGDAFTVVACHQGVQFFADKRAALTEMRRVLEPGGRLAVATWRSVEEMPILRDLQSVAERHLGAILDRRHSEGHPARLEQLLAQLAFNEVKSEVVSKTVRFAEPSTFIGLNAMALVGMSGAAGALDNEERTRVVHQITEESLAAASRYIDAGALMFDIASNLVTARA